MSMYISHYKNGNYLVTINRKDGTKLRISQEDIFIPNRVESMDVKITNMCHHNCEFCHENSNPYGHTASFSNIIKFASTLPIYTEIALGGGNLMEVPTFTHNCLMIFKKYNAICSITIRQDDFITYYDTIKDWMNEKLIYGIGVSLTNAKDDRLWDLLEKTPNAVLHTIVGMLTSFEINKIKEHKPKILILGYKNIRRGKDFLKTNELEVHLKTEHLKNHIIELMTACDICSFDNLALEQLDIQSKVNKTDWETYYMGDDGTTTFYVDLVRMEYAISSTHLYPERFPIGNKSVQEMYDHIISLKGEE